MYQIPRNALMLLLMSMGMVILPHVLRLPVWVTVFCFACGIWRVMVYQGRWSYPRTWVKAVFIVGGFVGVGVGYGTMLGVEPWVGILIVAFVLKLLEMHQKRDAYVAVLLAFFVAMTQFLFEQSIPYTLYMSLAVGVVTASLVALNQTTPIESVWPLLRKSGLMLAQAVPLMLVLFVLFPRIGPLWSVPMQTDVARTGVSDSISPGDIANLVQSDELAFRATFEGDIPSYSQLYWRGIVLSRFDASEQSWNQQPPRAYGPTLRKGGRQVDWEDQLVYLGDPVTYDIILEPTNRNYLFSLDLPQPVASDNMGLVQDFRFYSFREIRSKRRYKLTSYLDHQMDPVLSPGWRLRYLYLPPYDNPQTKQLAAAIRQNTETDQEFLTEVMRLYALDDFVYTLKPPLLSGNTIDQFLLESKRGFCEHFASSFVYLVRAGGIPARVVVGYQGGEYNERGNYVAVHQFDAHAWAEVWLEGEGWRRMDPTSIVAPNRIARGLESAVEDEQTFLAEAGLSLRRLSSSYLINELRLQISALNHYWDAWVVGYNPSMQTSLLTRYFGEMDRQKLGMLLIGTFFGMLAIVALILLMKRSRQKLSAAEHEYLRFCRMLEGLDLPRSVGEGPIDYANRVIKERPDLADTVKAVTDTYVRVNFEQDTPDDVEEMKRSLRTLRVRSFA